MEPFDLPAVSGGQYVMPITVDIKWVYDWQSDGACVNSLLMFRALSAYRVSRDVSGFSGGISILRR